MLTHVSPRRVCYLPWVQPLAGQILGHTVSGRVSHSTARFLPLRGLFTVLSSRGSNPRFFLLAPFRSLVPACLPPVFLSLSSFLIHHSNGSCWGSEVLRKHTIKAQRPAPRVASRTGVGPCARVRGAGAGAQTDDHAQQLSHLNVLFNAICGCFVLNTTHSNWSETNIQRTCRQAFSFPFLSPATFAVSVIPTCKHSGFEKARHSLQLAWCQSGSYLYNKCVQNSWLWVETLSQVFST